MLAEVRLVIVNTEARLTLRRGDDVVDDEAWRLPKSVGHTETSALAKAIFDSVYDAMNYASEDRD